MIRSVIIAIVAVLGACADAGQSARMAAASECIGDRDYECVFDHYIVEIKEAQRSLFSPGTTSPSVFGARVEYVLGMASGEMEPAKLREASEFLIDRVQSEHEGTPYFLFEFHMSRREACERLGDEECIKMSANFVCEGKDRLASPLFSERDEAGRKNLEPRLMKALSLCEDA